MERFGAPLPLSIKGPHKTPQEFIWEFEELCPKRKGELEIDPLSEKEGSPDFRQLKP